MSTTPSLSPKKQIMCTVTGGSRGIGLAIVHAFLALEHCIVLSLDVVAPNDETSRQAISQGKLRYKQVDVSDSAAFEASLLSEFQQCGDRIDCMVNNAGIFETEENGNVPWDDTTTNEQIDRILLTNIGGVIHGTRIAARIMKMNPSMRISACTIVNIASTAALSSFPNHAVYGATKSAVLHFSQTADLDLRPDGIRVFCVCPGIIDTEMGRMGGEANRRAVALLKGGKRTRPELVAEAVLGLFSRKKEWTECSYLVVDNHEIIKGPTHDHVKESDNDESPFLAR